MLCVPGVEMRHPKTKLCLIVIGDAASFSDTNLPYKLQERHTGKYPKKSSELRKYNLILKSNNINKHQKTEILLHINCHVSVDVHFLSFKIFGGGHKSGIQEYFRNIF